MDKNTAVELLRVDEVVATLQELDATEYGTEALAMEQATFSDYGI
ncbi:hypothetical protein ACSHXN_45630 (plasmid) [Streptomyces sp. HUAS TT11]